jgi:cation-transporting ATPase E
VELINATISVLISVIPQGVIIMVNVALVLGVYRMYKQKILVQKSSAIEALSAIDVLCFDKTGTITENKLKVDNFQAISGNYEMTEGEVISLIKFYCEHTIEKNKTVLAISRYLEDSDAAEAKVIDQLPFNSRDKVSAMDISYFGKQYRIMLSSVDMAAPRLSSDREREILLSFEKEQSERAMRNLTFTIKSIVNSHADQKWKIQTESGFQLLAKVGLRDTLRPGAAEVLREFKRTGVRPVVITGDSKKTVIAILKQLNIDFLDRAVTGSELNTMTGVQKRKAILSHDVFAAVSPEQKSEIVSVYQEQDQTVGMVGDGVNDALAIKQANLGISLSAGAGVSRDISDVVLLDNNLARLLDVVKEGKSIVYSTLRSAKVLLIKNFYIAWVILGTIFLQLPFVVNPRTLFLLAFLNGNFPSLDFVTSKHTNYDGDRFLPDLLKFTIIGSVSFTIVTLAFMLYRQSQGIASAELVSDTIALMSFLGVINYLIIAQDSFNLLKLRFTVRRIGVILLIVLSYLTAVLIPIFSDFFMLYLPTARAGIAIAISGVVYFALLAISSKVGDKLVNG